MIGQSAGLLFKIDADSSQAQREIKAVETSIGSLGSKFSTFAGAATVGAAAIAAIGTAAIAGATALFNFTKEAAEFGSTLYDASIKTGLSAASISALKVAAEGSGSSLEAAAGSVAKLNVLVGQAAQGNEKAADTLKRYGITATDTNEAFEQAIAVIGRMTTQDQKAAAAKDLFKDKTAQILPIIDQVNGNFKEYTETARKLGIVLSEEDLKAADDFGDTLGVLGTQAKIAGVKFASELMPMITGAMTSISKFMADNKDVVREWGKYAVEVAGGVKAAFILLGDAITLNLNVITGGLYGQHSAWSTWGTVAMTAINLVFGGIIATLNAFKELNRLINGDVVGGPIKYAPGQSPAELTRPPRLGGGGGGKGGGGGGSAKSDAEAKAREELQGQIEGQKFALEQLEKEYKDTMKRIREEFKKSGDSDAFTLAANAANEKLSNGANAVIAVLDELERKAIKDPTKTKIANLNNKQQERADDLNILKTEDFEENGELIKAAVQKIFDDLKKIADDNAKDLREAVFDGGLADAEQAATRYKELLASGMTKSKAVQSEMGALLKILAKNYRVLTDEQDAYFEQQVDDLESWREKEEAKAVATIQDSEDLQTALDKINNEYGRMLVLLDQLDSKRRKQIDKATAIPVTASSPEYNFGLADTWDQFKNSVIQDGPTIGESLAAVGQIGMNAFKGLAEGIGSMVQAWVLYGSAGPNAMKKMVASVLAGVAAQSAVLAIFELAKGFAALFWNPVEAGFHFKSAALFGSIAVATGLAGRAVAGDSFNQQASGGSSGGGSGGDAAGQPEKLNFTERFNGFQQGLTDQMARVMQRTNEVLGGVTEAVDTFNQKFGITTPGAVVMAGAGDAGEAIFGAVTGHLDSDLRAGSDFIRSQGKMT